MGGSRPPMTARRWVTCARTLRTPAGHDRIGQLKLVLSAGVSHRKLYPPHGEIVDLQIANTGALDDEAIDCQLTDCQKPDGRSTDRQRTERDRADRQRRRRALARQRAFPGLTYRIGHATPAAGHT